MLALPPSQGPRNSNHVALEELPAPVRFLPQNKAGEADPDPGDRPAVGMRCAVLCPRPSLQYEPGDAVVAIRSTSGHRQSGLLETR